MTTQATEVTPEETTTEATKPTRRSSLPPADYILVSMGLPNAKRETAKDGSYNRRHGHIAALGPKDHRQTVGEHMKAAEALGAPGATTELKWELRDGYALVFHPQTGEDVTKDYAQGENRKTKDPSYVKPEPKAKKEPKAKTPAAAPVEVPSWDAGQVAEAIEKFQQKAKELNLGMDLEGITNMVNEFGPQQMAEDYDFVIETEPAPEPEVEDLGSEDEGEEPHIIV